MHHALEIQEILSDIFSYCSAPVTSDYGANLNPDLAALARTCRSFKEPALDALWGVLNDSSPLARCLPDASQRSPRYKSRYAFTRPLTHPEWDILQSYACRIRLIQDYCGGLDWDSVAAFLSLPSTDSLFPKLRALRCVYTEKTMALLNLSFPSLVFLSVNFETSRLLQNAFKRFPAFSPSIKELSIHISQSDASFIRIAPNYLCRWRNLCSVDCPQVALGVDDLAHLSHMPALTRLSIALKAAFLPSSSLLFSKLHTLALRSESLDLVLRFLSHTRLPIITRFSAGIEDRPSRRGLSSFFACVPTSNTGHTIQRLVLYRLFPLSAPLLDRKDILIDYEDLRPCMVFSNLSHFELNIECNIGLTDSQVVELGSAWTRLKHLLINESPGWNLRGGITPGGLVRLLQTCQSLDHIALQFDMRGYTRVAQCHVPANLGLALPPVLVIDVLDSAVEAEAVTAAADFFAGFVTYPKTRLLVQAWRGASMIVHPRVDEYERRWAEVFRRAYSPSRGS